MGLRPSIRRDDNHIPRSSREPGLAALQARIALTVVTAALLNPLQPAVGIGALVGIVLVDTGMHAALAGSFGDIFWSDRGGKNRRSRSRRSRCGRLGCWLGSGF